MEPPSSFELDLNALNRIAARPFNEVVFRHAYLPKKGAPDPFFGTGIAGRYGTEAGTIYTTSSTQIMWAEYCRHAWQEIENANPLPHKLEAIDIQSMPLTVLGNPVQPRTLVKLDVSLARVADLTTGSAQFTLFSAGFDPLHLTSDGHGACLALAAAAITLGWEAIKVPSAAWRITPGWCLPIFKQTADFATIPWEVGVLNARPTLDIAHLTTYETGRRPSWLPGPPMLP